MAFLNTLYAHLLSGKVGQTVLKKMSSQVDKINDQISIKYYAALPYCVLIYFRTRKLLNLFSLDGLYFYVHVIGIFFPPN